MFRKIIVSVVLYTLMGVSFSFASQRVGVVGAANKNISAKSEDGNSRSLNLGDDIFFKETISSDANGNAQLMFVDKSALTVGANSSVVIDEFVYNPSTSSGNMLMRGTKGTFRFIGGALSKKNAVKIKTPVGTIGIRGGIAIVDINPVSGATNATFVYGDVLTFENLAGDIQSISDRGVGLAVDTPNTVPQIFRATTEQIANQVQTLTGRPGTFAGATVVPSDDVVDKKLKMELGLDNNENDNNPNVQGEKKGEGDGAENKDGKQKNKKVSRNKKGQRGDRQNDGGSDRSEQGDDDGRYASDDRNAEHEDGGHMTEDGGYVDEDGNYHSPEEVAEHNERRNNKGRNYTENRRDRNNQDNAMGDRGSREGGPQRADGGGGYMAPDGGFIDENGEYHSPSEVQAYREGEKGGAITLTQDGGYVDSEGNYHDATELAAYRVGETDSTASSGGYYDPNGGTYYDGDGGYYDPNGGTYYGGDGGYYDPNGGTYYDGDRADGGGGYYDPNGGTYYGGDGGYYDPNGGTYYGGDGGYYDPNFDPNLDHIDDSTNTNTSTLTNITHRGLYSFMSSGGGIFDEGDIYAEDLSTLGKFKLNLVNLSSGNSFYRTISNNYSSGYRNISSALGTSLNATGWVFATPNMFTYRLELNRALGDNFGNYGQRNIVVGKQVSSLPTSGKQFFNFLPDINLYLSSGSSNLGFFDWNLADSRLIEGTGISNPGSTNGLLVDWGKKSFLGGKLKWGIGDLKVAYGKVYPGSFYGRVFDYNGISQGVKSRYLDVLGSEVYGSGSVVDGFMASGGLYNGAYIDTPMVSSSQSYSNDYVNGTGGHLPFGYISGFIVNNDNGTVSYNRYKQNNFAFTKDGAGQINGATLSLDKISGTGPTNAYANFNGQYGYIDDNAYALQQSGGNGVLVSSKLLTNDGCSSCQYAHWGVWASETSVSAGNVDIAHMIPYVAGTITDNAGITSAVDGTYTGSVFGNVLSGGALYNKTGTVTIPITFDGSGGATIADVSINMNLGGYNMTNDGPISITNGMFDNKNLNITGTATGTGVVNGALFGPNAENIGGNFNFTAGSAEGTGVYLGAK